jgi:hypothetical protein
MAHSAAGNSLSVTYLTAAGGDSAPTLGEQRTARTIVYNSLRQSQPCYQRGRNIIDLKYELLYVNAAVQQRRSERRSKVCYG